MDLRADAPAAGGTGGDDGVAGRSGTLGPYQMIRSLGQGGAGEVWLARGPARDGQLGEVAIKVLRGGAHQPAVWTMAEQARAMARVDDAHALPVYAVDRAADALYVVMAYAPGRTLEAQMRNAAESGLWLPLEQLDVARVVADLGRVLKAAHTLGVVHGDLRPANLFVRPTAHGGLRVAVADFGQKMVVEEAARAAAAGGAEWAAERLCCAAPEQLMGQTTAASDQYALATIAYLLLTGRYPFTGSAQALGMALLHEPPPPPTQSNPALTHAAEAALLRALEKDPALRFPSVAAFARALCEALAPGPRSWEEAARQVRHGSARRGSGAAEVDGRAMAIGKAAGQSFEPTGFAPLDHVLTLVDRVTGGRAGALWHVTSYLIAGGFAAVINLLCLHLLYDVLPMPVPNQAHYVIATIVASEISIVANFIPNDLLTFRHMAGHARSWWVRCLRFHSTCIAGTLLTVVISYVLHYQAGLGAVVAQAIAIIIALVFNFTMHHIWTYRRMAQHA